jgi:hypothetical protein
MDGSEGRTGAMPCLGSHVAACIGRDVRSPLPGWSADGNLQSVISGVESQGGIVVRWPVAWGEVLLTYPR